MSSTKRIQGKLFRGESGGDDGSDPAKAGSLTIDIPSNTLQTKSIQPLKTFKLTEGAEADNNAPEDRYTIPYRDRLLRRIGNEYRGVERYRLEADRKKEVHWKRWGPYLSDRQWVSLSYLHATGKLLSVFLYSGNRSRGLLPQRRCLEPLPPRACAFKGLSMGRRWYCRYLR